MEGLTGFKESMATLQNMKRQGDQKMQLMIERALREIAKYAKQNGPWEDQTGNLRNSIGINYPLMQTWRAADHKIEELKAQEAQFMTPVLEKEGTKVWGYIYAGMEYAIHVERLDGYWVLEGALNYFKPLLENIFKEELAFRPQEITKR